MTNDATGASGRASAQPGDSSQVGVPLSGSGGSGVAVIGVAGNAASAAANVTLCADGNLQCGTQCLPSDAQNCGRCGHNCTTLQHVTGAVSCSAGGCSFARTSCAPGWANCTNDPETGCETDVTVPAHCGRCDVQCSGTTPICSSGTCSSGCPSHTPSLCEGACVDPQTSANHCGRCGNKCTTSVQHAEPTCAQGSCGFTCNGAFTECSGACVDLTTDSANCGSCGTRCGTGKSCQAGQCQCAAKTHDCSGACVKDDDVNSCGTSCSPCRTTVAHATPACSQGQCGFKCDAVYSLCGGTCIDTLSDPANCGTCGNSCRGGKQCTLGLCTCTFGTHDCNGTCASSTAITSCGLACNTTCPGPTSGSGMATCDGFSCGVRCSSGTLCGKACTDVNSDSSNCGSCGNVCSADKTCRSGRCECPTGKHDCNGVCAYDDSVDSCGTLCTPCSQPVNGVGYAVCDYVTLQCSAKCPDGLTYCNRGCYEFCAI